MRSGPPARTRSITLSVPDDLLKRAKWLAVQADTSLSGLLTSYLEQIAEEHDHYAAARVRALARLRVGFPVGAVGNAYAWSREELHERE